MNRKTFVSHLKTLSAGAVAGGFGLGTLDRPVGKSRRMVSSGKMPLPVLNRIRNDYEEELFDRFLPAMDRYVVDHELGGFMCDADIRTGERISGQKRAWYEGRGMWLYSTLYHRFQQDPEYLNIATASKEFILPHRPVKGRFWPSRFDRNGNVLDEEGDIFTNLYIAEGLSAYAVAAGDDESLQQAIDITWDAFRTYDDRDYQYGSSAARGLEGPRVLNHWMVFLFTAVQILEQVNSPEMRHITDRSVEAVLSYHMNPDYQLLNDTLTHDLILPDDKERHIASIGLGIQTLWMTMHEAVRRRAPSLFRRAAEHFKRHVTVAKDQVYGGYFGTLADVEANRWSLNKALGVQEEVLIGSLLLMEHAGDPWGLDCFLETEAYIKSHFVKDGYKFWISGADRFIENYQTGRVEHYHHSRHLMFTILAMKRMLSRDGAVSGLFGSL